jgi:hypothetical protein
MFDEQVYCDYLIKKKKKDKTVTENIKILKDFFDFITENGVSVSQDLTAEDIDEHIKSFLGWQLVEQHNRIAALTEYIAFIKKESANLDLIALADAIHASLMKRYEHTAKQSAASRRENIVLIPNGVKIAPKHLGELTNDEFVAAFREMQEIIISIYDDIEESPFSWGYPDFDQTGGYYNRVTDFLFAFAFNGIYDNGVLTVNTKAFLSDTRIKKHKKIEQMISGFAAMGFAIDGFDKKSVSFSVTYLDNPRVISALNAYINEIDRNKQDWWLGIPRLSFSYRFIEDPNEQKYEAVFLSELDYKSEKLREIQYLLHAEAAKLGFRIDTGEWMEKGCILYKKGSKRFMLVGEEKNGDVPIVVTRVILRNVFETHRDNIEQLALKFPEAFIPKMKACINCKGCQMAIKYELNGERYSACAFHSFWFKGVMLDNIGVILELFKIENKIK